MKRLTLVPVMAILLLQSPAFSEVGGSFTITATVTKIQPEPGGLKIRFRDHAAVYRVKSEVPKRPQIEKALKASLDANSEVSVLVDDTYLVIQSIGTK